MRFRLPILAIISVIVIHITLLATGVYERVSEIDSLLHFAGGFVMGLLAIAIHHDMTDKHDLKRHPDWYRLLFVLGFVMLVGVAWEFHEYVLDNTAVVWWGWPKNQLDLADTMLDFLLDGAGAVVAFALFKRQM